MALAQVALAGPDPHGHGGGKDHPGGKPSPSPTAPASPTAEPSPTVDPSPTADPAEDGTSPSGPNDAATAAVTEETASNDSPGGGSGVVKLDRKPFDQAPNNEPHVGCTFQVDFYNYPEGGLQARYTFSLWSPTGHGELMSGTIALEDDPASGGLDLDGEETVELGPAIAASGQVPHQHNGWHVKLVVNARHSSGPDQKQKVFWVRECKASTPTTSPSESPSKSPPVEPSTITPPGPIAFTGSEIARLGALGLLALVLGSGALWLSARLRREAP
jgi:hypothetical protein